MALLVNSNKHWRKKTVPILHKFFQKIEQEEITPNLPYEVRINLILKLNKDITKGYYVPYGHRCKILKQNLANRIQYIKRIIHPDQRGFIPGMRGWFTIQSTIKVMHHINKLINKNHMIILISSEEYLTKPKIHSWLKLLAN